MAYISKIGANLTLNVADFRRGLEDGQAALKKFEKDALRSLNNLAGGRGGAKGGFSQGERFTEAVRRAQAGAVDPNAIARATSRQGQFEVGDRFGQARQGLDQLSGMNQMKLESQFQSAARAVQLLNSELATTGTISKGTFDAANTEVNKLTEGVNDAAAAEQNMAAANAKLTSLAASGAKIQQEQVASAEKLEAQRTAAYTKQAADRAKADEQAARKAEASAQSLDAMRSAAHLKDMQRQEQAAASLKRQRDAAGQAEMEKSLKYKFSDVANKEFFDDRRLGVASAKLSAFRGIMGQVNSTAEDTAETFNRLVFLQDKAAKMGVEGQRKYGAEIARTEKILATQIATEARRNGVNIGGAGGIMRQVQAAGGRGGFMAGGQGAFAAQQLAFAFEDAMMSTDGLRGAIRGATNNLTLLASMLPGPTGALATLGLVIGGTLIGTIMKLNDAKNEEINAEKKRTQELEKAAKAASTQTAMILRTTNAFNGFYNKLRDQSTGGLTEAEAKEREIVGAARSQANTVIDRELRELFGDNEASGLSPSVTAWGGLPEEVVVGVRSAFAAAQAEVARLEAQIQSSASTQDRADLERQLVNAQETLAEQRRAALETFSMGDAADSLTRATTALGRLDTLGEQISKLRDSGEAIGLGAEWNQQFQQIRDGLAEVVMRGGMDPNAYREQRNLAEAFLADTKRRIEQVEGDRRQDALEKEADDRKKLQDQAYLSKSSTMDLQKEITDFIVGGLRVTGGDIATVAEQARLAFQPEGFSEKMFTGPSKEPIGAAALRESAGGAEQTRLLSGTDSNAKTREVNQQQLEQQKKTNDLLNRLIKLSPQLAEAV